MTHKNWKKFVGMGFLLLAIILAGCTKKEENIDGVVTGTDGLVISFVENFPQEKYIIMENSLCAENLMKQRILIRKRRMNILMMK